jgi:dihydrodiol dehydrogenase / D-xylose 1-dehydrogenase (NADP)
MEAMWTRFFPVVQRTQEILTQGLLGAPEGVQANFGFNLPFDGEHRLYSKEKGGGAALDIGCYCIQWGTMVFGSTMPDQLASSGRLAPTGVDVDGAISMTWAGQGTVSLQFGVNAIYPEETMIFCERGYIKICSPAHAPTRLEVYKSAGRTNNLVEVFEQPLPDVPIPINFPHSEGMVYQVQHVEGCLARGLTESPLYSLSETITVAKVLDSFLSNVGVDYSA